MFTFVTTAVRREQATIVAVYYICFLHYGFYRCQIYDNVQSNSLERLLFEKTWSPAVVLTNVNPSCECSWFYRHAAVV